MKLRAAIYVRVSTTEQAEEGFSIKAQTEKLKNFANAKDYNFVKTYTDPGFSGAKLERPALKELINDIEKGFIDIVLVYKLDRLSRSQKNTLYLIEDVFLKNSVQFVSMQESFDTSTSFGRAMIGVLSVFAQLERDAITERMQMGAKERAKAGLYHGSGAGTIPTGYDYVNGELVINEYSDVVKDIFELYINGLGLNAISVKLKEKYPSKKISRGTVLGGILDNDVYIGKVKYAGKSYEGKHEAIISEKQYNIVKAIRTRKSDTYKNQTHKKYMLTGLLRCAYCGGRVARSGIAREKSNGLEFYYECYSRRKSPAHMIKDPNCPSKRHKNTEIEYDVIEFVKNIRFNHDNKNEINNKIDEVTTMKKELNSLDSQIDKMIELYQVSAIPMDKINTKISDLNRKKESLTDKIKNLKLSSISKVNREEKIKEVESFDWDNSDIPQKANLLKSVIDEIIIYNDTFEINWSI